MYCTRCGHELLENSRFCSECGAALTLKRDESTQGQQTETLTPQGEKNPPVLETAVADGNGPAEETLSIKPLKKHSLGLPIVLTVFSAFNFGFTTIWLIFWLSSLGLSLSALILVLKSNKSLQNGGRECYLKLALWIKVLLTGAVVVIIISLVYGFINIDYEALRRMFSF